MKHPLRTPHVFAIAATMAAVSLVPVAPASAQPYPTQKRTKITFSTPVEVPNAVLQPGTYWFQVVDSQSNLASGGRNNIKIMNEDESKLVASASAIAIERDPAKIKGDTVLLLNPTEANAVGALDAWFYPGDTYGHEFVYPQQQAAQIASHTRMSVLASEGGKTYRLQPTGERELWVAGNSSQDSWQKMHDAEVGSRESGAVATSGRTKADAHEGMTDSMSAKDHVKALEEIVNNALKKGGDTVTLDRATLMDMRAQLNGLQQELEKK
jgi:hypothetical protein